MSMQVKPAAGSRSALGQGIIPERMRLYPGRCTIAHAEVDPTEVQEPLPWVLGQGHVAPYSPDLNPMDFGIWPILEADVCASPHSSTAVLKQALETTWSNMCEDTVRRSCLSVMRRLEAVVKARVVTSKSSAAV